jgi:hypothetical protein
MEFAGIVGAATVLTQIFKQFEVVQKIPSNLLVIIIAEILAFVTALALEMPLTQSSIAGIFLDALFAGLAGTGVHQAGVKIVR